MKSKMKSFFHKYFPVSQKRHRAELDQLRNQLNSLHERELLDMSKTLDQLIPKLARITLEKPPHIREHKLQIALNEYMMIEMQGADYSHHKEAIARSIGRMVEYEILRIHFVSPQTRFY